jgi:hypothetical protein
LKHAISNARSADSDYGSLYEAFQACMPPLVKMAIMQNGTKGAEGVNLPPPALWLYTLMHIGLQLHSCEPSFRRFHVTDRAKQQVLVLDVRDPILTCPDDGSVLHGPVSDKSLASRKFRDKLGLADEPLEPTKLKAGTCVSLLGLSVRPELNGKLGAIISWDAKAERYKVEVEGGQGPFQLKTENVKEWTKTSRFEGEAPLILVRWMLLHNKAGGLSPDERRKHSMTRGQNSRASRMDGWLNAACSAANREEDSNMVIIAESIDEINTAVADLKANQATLSAAYMRHFRSMSPNHGDFQPSFIVPPLNVPERNKVNHEVPRCANPTCRCEASEGEKFSQCTKCRSAMYCKKQCQVAHWPVHKKVCNKSAEEINSSEDVGTGDGTRESLLFPLDTCDRALRGMPPERRQEMLNLAASRGEPLCTFSHNIADKQRVKTTTAAAPRESKVPRNIYGDSEFVVKVQVPLSRHPGERARFMVYDKGKTTEEQYFEPGRHGDAGARVEKLILAQGNGQMKGYFKARREGANIRLFTGRILPFPQPPW